jgi:hypothetical protein
MARIRPESEWWTAGGSNPRPLHCEGGDTSETGGVSQPNSAVCTQYEWRAWFLRPFRRLVRAFGWRPAAVRRLSEAEDTQQDRAYQKLARRLRG